MKKVKVDYLTNYAPARCYASDGVQFSWLGVPRKNVFPQVTSWHGCRETFVGEIKRWTDSNGKWSYLRNMDLRRMRFACIRKYSNNMADGTWKKKCAYDLVWFGEAKRILNVFEKHLGWGLTTVAHVKDGNLTKVRANVFVFSGSCKWMRSPQLISMYLLLLRLSRHGYFRKFESIETIDDFNETMKSRSHGDAHYWKSLYPYLLAILDNHKDLFFRRSIKTAYASQSGWNGINSMITGSCDTVTKRRFNKIKATLTKKK